jgi:hypothetical protein
MPHTAPSALITDKGERILLRINGTFYNVSQDELRSLLGLPAGSGGMGISIDGDRLRFEFVADQQTVELSAGQLHRRLAKQTATGT